MNVIVIQEYDIDKTIAHSKTGQIYMRTYMQHEAQFWIDCWRAPLS